MKVTKIHDHVKSGLNSDIEILALNPIHDNSKLASFHVTTHLSRGRLSKVAIFFNDAVHADANGITEEVLLAILLHRLKGAREDSLNAELERKALAHISLALETLKQRA